MEFETLLWSVWKNDQFQP